MLLFPPCLVREKAMRANKGWEMSRRKEVLKLIESGVADFEKNENIALIQSKQFQIVLSVKKYRVKQLK